MHRRSDVPVNLFDDLGYQIQPILNGWRWFLIVVAMIGFADYVVAQPKCKIIARYGIGVAGLQPASVYAHHEVEPFRQAGLRLMRQQGLYNEVAGGVEFLSDTVRDCIR